MKNVVLPAPLGPMIETIERSGISNETSLTATSPPKIFETDSVSSSVFAPLAPDVAGADAGRAHSLAPRVHVGLGRRADRVARADALGELHRPSSLGQQPLRAQHHDEQDEEAEDAEVQDREVEVQAQGARHAVEHLGDEVRVDERQQHRAEHDAPDRAQAAEDDHRQHEDREAELELIGLHGGLVGTEERARHAAEGGAGGVGQQLGLDERHAHRRCGDLVLADRDPGAPEARVAQAEVHEQDERDEHEHEPEVRSEVERRVKRGEHRQVDRVDRRDRLAAVGELVALDDVDLVAVDGEAVDDLAERERHDRDVVPAQAQRRQADQHPGDADDEHGDDEDDQEVQVDAGQVAGEVAGEDVDALLAVDRREVIGGEPPHRVRADRVERDVAEVQEAREADDDVQAQRHDDVGAGGDEVVGDARQRVEEQRQDRGKAQAEDREREVLVVAEPADDGVHPASLVASPMSPCGRKTMISTR